MKQSKIRNLNNQCPGRWVSSRFSSNLAFFSFLFTFLAAIPLLGINGHITTNTTWSSDITVTGDLWIDENATLTIQAGVTVWVPKIDQNQDTIGDIDIIVNGRLVCTGTDTDKVRFLSMEDTPGSQDWAGITLSAGATQNQSILTSVHIRNAYRGILINGIGLQATDLKVYKGGDYGIRVQNTTSMTRFTFTTIEDIDGNGMTVESGSVTFTDTNITNNGGYGLKALGPVTLSATRLNLVQNGSYGLWLENTNTASFTDGRFNSNTNHGIYIDRMSPVFANCQINNNKQHGIYIIGNAGTPSFTNCTISSNHFGISFISRPGTLSYCNIENNEMYGIYIYRSNPTINNSNITNNGSVIGDPGLQTLTLPSQTSWRSTGSPVVMPLGIYNQINPNGDKMLIYNLSYEKDGDSYTNNSSSSRYYRNYTRLICNGSYFLDNTHQSNVYSYNSYDMSQISVTGTIEQIIDANSQISLEVYQIENCPNARAWVSSFSYLKFSTCGVNNLASTSANLQNNWWGQVTGIDNLVNLVIPSTANYEGAWVSRVETAGCNLPNLSPTLVLTHPEALQIDPSSYELKWIARDYDDDARVSLYYNLEEDINGILIAGNLSEDDVDSYVWNFENTPFGRYYLYARIEDGSNPALYSFALGQIMVGPLTIKIEDLYAAAGDTITVPLKAYNAYENFDLNAFQITIGYSHTLLTYVDTVVDDTLIEDWSVNINSDIIGQVSLNGYSVGNLDSSGDLFRLRFIVNPAAADLQNTDLVISNFQYNNGSPVPIITPGIFTVRNRYDMDGWTQYYSNENPISEVDISATGFSSGSQISDEDGYFNFSQHYYGNYELVPEFIGAVPEIVVSPFDASLIARYALGLETLSSSQISAGNVDGDGDVDIYDAALVARYCVGLIPEFTAGTMIFTPLNHSFLLSPSYTARTFTGIAIGDVSGNWGSTRNDNISPEVAYEQFEDEENLYLKVSYPHPFYSLYSKLFYDPETLEYLSHAFGNGGTDLSALVNSESGLLQLAAYGVTAEPGGENVITFSFRKLTPANGEIGISHIVFDESIGAPTANDDQISPVITNLRQNYPNPFNPSTTISFSLSQAQQVKLDVYNIKGQKVHSLANGGFNAGLHNLTWDAAGFGSGIYFARISTSEGYSKTIKMMLMK